MAPQFTDADYQILTSCLKNSSTKLTPDFDEVAKECGLKDSRAAYFRHWNMMKKLGLTGTRSRAQAAPKKEVAGGSASKKRGATATEEAEDGDGDEDGGGEEQEEVSVEPETPTKKAKRTA